MQTSIPEQTIFYYIKKYIDKDAKNNFQIEKYRADIFLSYCDKIYDIEYDAFSTHNNSIEKDMKRDEFMTRQGYFVVRMRDRNLPFLDNITNFRFDFQNYSKKSISLANQGIQSLLAFFNCYEKN